MSSKFAFFLHMYQPPFPVQTPEVLDRIINNSYIPLTKEFIKTGKRLTININASLTEMLEIHQTGNQVIANLNTLASNNQIEFLESGAYHPLLPLLSAEDINAQIKLNHKINSRILGSCYRPVGFFPPELALDNNVAKIVSKYEGYRYTLASDPTFGSLSFDKIPYFISKGRKFFVIRRNRFLSNDIAFRSFSTVEAVESAFSRFDYVPVVGMDFETFGEHHFGYETFLSKILNKITSVPVYEYLDTMIQQDKVIEIALEDLKPSSWSTEPNDITRGIPFPLWDNPTNVLHQLILTLMDILEQSMQFIEPKDRPINFYKSQQSCQLWWCSEGRFGPSLVKRATSFQVSTLTSIQDLVQNFSPERKKALDSLLGIADRLLKKINYLIEVRTFTK